MKKLPILLAIAILVLLGIYAYNARTAPKEPVQSETVQNTTPEPTTPPTPSELLELTNIEREKAGVAPLKLDERLNQSAQAKAQDMVDNSYYDHVNPKTGKNGATYALERVPECKLASENLILYNEGFSTPQNTIDGWMNSPPHRKQIINNENDIIGFSLHGKYLVAHFCDL